MNDDPNTSRLLQTRDGVASIPRDQAGVPLKDYFRNAEFPQTLDAAVVYATDKGPVLARADPVAFGPQHHEKAEGFAEKLKTMIDEKGYYAASLNRYARILSEETGRTRDEMKALIAGKFEQANGQEPYPYLKDERIRKGLPVADRDQSSTIAPDMS